jgi:hypothetical protein
MQFTVARANVALNAPIIECVPIFCRVALIEPNRFVHIP